MRSVDGLIVRGSPASSVVEVTELSSILGICDLGGSAVNAAPTSPLSLVLKPRTTLGPALIHGATAN